jgi:hypothetical protein
VHQLDDLAQRGHGARLAARMVVEPGEPLGEPVDTARRR